MTEYTLHVQGLTEDAEATIARILNAINGVDGVHTSPAAGTVRIEIEEEVPIEMLRAAIEGLGFSVTEDVIED